MKKKPTVQFVGEAASLLNTRQCAEYLNVSEWYVLDHTRGGKQPVIPCRMLGRNSRRFVKSELDAWVSRLSRKSAAA